MISFTDEIIEKILLDKEFEANIVHDCFKDYYCHCTFKIDNLVSYIKFIGIVKKISSQENFLDTIICYRGMENSEWRLIPSIEVNHLVTEETSMYREFERLWPNEFIDIKNSLNKIAKMQHFALPTRLLDFSLNPLVALFFACDSTMKENNDKDGRVVIHISENIDNEMGEKICNFILYGEDYRKGIDEFFEDYYEFNGDFPVVKPLYITERERKQQSLFLVFPCKLVQKEYLNGIKNISKEFMKSNFFSIIINSQAKKKILNELDNIGINKMVLYPELEYTGMYLKDKYIKRVETSVNKYEELIKEYEKCGDIDATNDYKKLKMDFFGV